MAQPHRHTRCSGDEYCYAASIARELTVRPDETTSWLFSATSSHTRTTPIFHSKIVLHDKTLSASNNPSPLRQHCLDDPPEIMEENPMQHLTPQDGQFRPSSSVSGVLLLGCPNSIDIFIVELVLRSLAGRDVLLELHDSVNDKIRCRMNKGPRYVPCNPFRQKSDLWSRRAGSSPRPRSDWQGLTRRMPIHSGFSEGSLATRVRFFFFQPTVLPLAFHAPGETSLGCRMPPQMMFPT